MSSAKTLNYKSRFNIFFVIISFGTGLMAIKNVPFMGLIWIAIPFLLFKGEFLVQRLLIGILTFFVSQAVSNLNIAASTVALLLHSMAYFYLQPDYSSKINGRAIQRIVLALMATTVTFFSLFWFINQITIDRYVLALSRSWDYLAHFAMVDQISITNSVYEFTPRSDFNEGFLHYPQLWHSTTSLLFGGFFGEKRNTSLGFFILSVLLTLVFSLAPFYKDIFLPFRRKFSNNSIEINIAKFSMSLFAVLFLVSYLFTHGYPNFAFATTLICFACKPKTQNFTRELLLVSATLAYSNYAIVLLAFLFLKFVGKKHHMFRSLGSSYFSLISILFVVIGSFNAKQTDSILIGGPINGQNKLILVLFVFTTVAITSFRMPRKNTLIWSIIISNILFLGFTFLIYLLTGDYSYFAGKMILGLTVVNIFCLNFLIDLKGAFFSTNGNYFSSTQHFRTSLEKRKPLWAIPIFLVIFYFATLLPANKNYYDSLLAEYPRDQFNWTMPIFNEYMDANVLVLPHDYNAFGYEAYLINQWYSSLNRTFTTDKQNCIEANLRDVSTIVKSDFKILREIDRNFLLVRFDKSCRS